MREQQFLLNVLGDGQGCVRPLFLCGKVGYGALCSALFWFIQSNLRFFFSQAFMFWVVDNFLMRKGKTKAKLEERGANQDSRNGSKVRYRRAASHEESESEVGASLILPKSLAIIPWALGVSALKFVPEC